MAARIDITSTATAADGETITGTSYRLLDATEQELSDASPPYLGTDETALHHVEQEVTQSDEQTDSVVIAIPPKVTEMTATAVGHTAIRLNGPLSAGATEYAVHVSEEADFAPSGATLHDDVEDYVDYEVTGLEPDTTYYVQVLAKNAHGTWLTGNEASATTEEEPPEPGLLVSTYFVAADDTPLQTFTRDDGGAFVKHPLAPTQDLYITANRVRTTSSADPYYYAPDTPPSPNYWAEIEVRIMSVATRNVSVAVRHSATTADRYEVRLNPSTGVVALRAAGSVLDSWTLTGITAGDLVVLRVEADGSEIRGLVNGVERVAATNSTFTAAGHVAIHTGATGSATGPQIERCRAGSL